jgi:hypothetical protein
LWWLPAVRPLAWLLELEPHRIFARSHGSGISRKLAANRVDDLLAVLDQAHVEHQRAPARGETELVNAQLWIDPLCPQVNVTRVSLVEAGGFRSAERNQLLRARRSIACRIRHLHGICPGYFDI